MSYPTESCFVTGCQGWDEKTLQHPVMRFMKAYDTALGETKEMFTAPFGTWHTPDFAYTDAYGVTSRGEHALEMHTEMPRLLLENNYHEPQFVSISETPDGYSLFGYAAFYGNFKVPGEKNTADLSGKKWEFKAPGAWHFLLRKDESHPQGFKVSKLILFADTANIMARAVKKGMLPVELFYQKGE